MSLAHTRLTSEQIQEFKQLYKEHYDIELSDEEATKQGNKFIQFIGIIIENNEDFLEKEKPTEE